MRSESKAVIFDMDGLLIDSEPLWTRAEKEIFATVGIVLDDADCAETVGMGLDQVVLFRYRQKPWHSPPPQEIGRRIHRRVLELIRSEGTPKPGAREAVWLAGHLGFRVGLATSSDHELISASLERLGITSLFDHLQSAQDLERGKPHPDVYLECARALGVEPRHCIGVEDSVPGLQAVLAAGMKAIAVPEPRLRSRPEFRRAHVVLDSLEKLDERILLRLEER